MAKKAKRAVAADPSLSVIRNRIKAHRRVRAGDLIPHEQNFRRHPQHQKDALLGLYQEVGFARSLLAFETPEGKLKLIDGHLRQEIDPDMEVDVEVLDVTEDEARILLASMDPLAALAQTDKGNLEELLKLVRAQDDRVKEMLANLARDQGIAFGAAAQPPEDPGPQIDKAAELLDKWGVKTGDLYVIPSKTAPPRRVVTCPHCNCEQDV